jgi:uncharacterized membrane protein
VTASRLRIATAALALAGAGIAGYLLFERYSGGTIACSSGGCETVQSSSYALLAGIPVAALGLAMYVAILALTFVRGEGAHAVLLAVALTGVAFSGYLLWAQAGPIGAFCDWCLANDGIITAIAVLTLLRALPVRFGAWTSSSSTPAPPV